jgi:hypothetical protein
MITITQIVLSIILLFAASRVYLRFLNGTLRAAGYIFWIVIFGFAFIVVLVPNLSTDLAKLIGIGRGVDAVIYTSITLLFYLVFRLTIMFEEQKREISKLITELALRDKKHGKKRSTN